MEKSSIIEQNIIDITKLISGIDCSTVRKHIKAIKDFNKQDDYFRTAKESRDLYKTLLKCSNIFDGYTFHKLIFCVRKIYNINERFNEHLYE